MPSAVSMLRRPIVTFLVAVLTLLGAAGCSHIRPVSEPSSFEASVLLVSIDGFRWDYLDRFETPHLDRMAASGVHAKKLIPSFPTKTFPNHYTVVTGLYPGNHGVVANNMWDPVFETRFSLGARDEVESGRWYGGEPIWLTAERQGLRASPHFWPGGAADIQGELPTFKDSYDGDLDNRARIDTIVSRLALAPTERPRFAGLYFSLLDEAGHRHNPDSSPEVEGAATEADALMGYLFERLEEQKLTGSTHVIVVSDHGMSANDPSRAILLDQYVDLEIAGIIDWSPIAAFWPKPEHYETVLASLEDAHPNLAVYRREEIPERFHYRAHRRVPPIVAIADDGWAITTTERMERSPERFPKGSHGYDPALASMGALFIASGPRLREGLVLKDLENIHIYELMCRLLDLDPAPNDGSFEAVAEMLR